MYAASAESGRLAGSENPGKGLTVRTEDPCRQVGLEPTQRLAGEHVAAHRDEGIAGTI